MTAAATDLGLAETSAFSPTSAMSGATTKDRPFLLDPLLGECSDDADAPGCALAEPAGIAKRRGGGA
jgi:hypothetical protein